MSPSSVCSRSQTRLGNSPRRRVSSLASFMGRDYDHNEIRRLEMRQGFTKAMLAGAIAAALAFQAHAQQPVAGGETPQKQATWPAGPPLPENFPMFADRVAQPTPRQPK